MVFFLNAVLLLIAGFIIGWNFGVKTIFCVVVISLGMNFWQSVLPEGDFLHLERILAVILAVFWPVSVLRCVLHREVPRAVPTSWR